MKDADTSRTHNGVRPAHPTADFRRQLPGESPDTSAGWFAPDPPSLKTLNDSGTARSLLFTYGIIISQRDPIRKGARRNFCKSFFRYLIPAWKIRRDPVQIPQQAGGITMQLYGQQALSPWAAAKHRHRPANFSALLRFPFTTGSQWDFMCLAPHFPKLWEPNIQTFQ